jgi:hypothetical protein
MVACSSSRPARVPRVRNSSAFTVASRLASFFGRVGDAREVPRKATGSARKRRFRTGSIKIAGMSTQNYRQQTNNRGNTPPSGRSMPIASPRSRSPKRLVTWAASRLHALRLSPSPNGWQPARCSCRKCRPSLPRITGGGAVARLE